MTARTSSFLVRRSSRRGSVLIIVLWICLGLVALTLYFANSMSSELRAADNRLAEAEAREAVAAGTRYAAYLLQQLATGGNVPDPTTYKSEALPVGNATFWWIGRDPNATTSPTEPYFSLVDESSKLNLNSVSSSILQGLPNITTEVADAIVAWHRASGQSASMGDLSNTYSQLNPPRTNKGSAFESVDELRLVYGVTLDLFLGEDTNRNGVLDPNEDDGEASPPRDDHDGQLLAGISEYATVWSRLPTNGRTNITTPQTRGNFAAFLRRRGIENARATEVERAIGTTTFQSVAEFMVASRLTADEFNLIRTAVTDGGNQGRVNVNTAPYAVLACIFGPDNANLIVAYRTAHPDVMTTSMHWLLEAGVSANDIRRAGQNITDQSYQFSADIAAVGHQGRGYHREKVVFDLSSGTPRIVYRQDLTAYGWALGRQARLNLKGNNES